MRPLSASLIAARLAGLVALGGCCLVFQPALAIERMDSDAVAKCLFDNSGPDQLSVMKKLVLALLGDDAAAMRTAMKDYGRMVGELALSRCAMNPTQFDESGFDDAMEKYGELMGEKVLADAFAKIKQ